MAYLSRGKRAIKRSIENQKYSNCKRRCSPSSAAEYWCQVGLDQDGLEKKYISSYIGYGVFATKTFKTGDFLVEYRGKHLTKPASNNEYMFGFRHNEKYQWIDGSSKEGLGNFINDSEDGSAKNNAKMKKMVINSNPHLCLFAKRNIRSGEEIRYDYGDDPSKLYWRNQEEECTPGCNYDVHSDCQSESQQGTCQSESQQGTCQSESQQGTCQSESQQGTCQSESQQGTCQSESQQGTCQSESQQGTCQSESQQGTCQSESQQGTMVPYVSVLLKNGTEKPFKLNRLVHIGSSRSCDIIVKKDEVLPIHYKLHLEKTCVRLEDLSDGCVRNLTDGDIFQVADRTFILKYLLEDGNESESNLKESFNIKFSQNDSSQSDFSSSSENGNNENWSHRTSDEIININHEHDDNSYVSDSISSGDSWAPPSECSSSTDDEADASDSSGDSFSADQSVSTVYPVESHKSNTVLLHQTSSKVHCCFYCEKMYARISRHYQQVHKEEVEVAKILALPIKSKQRKMFWAELVNRGDFAHNFHVIEKKSGVMITKYRPRKGYHKEAAQYVPCSFCLGSYVSTDLWRHQKTCHVKKNKEESKKTEGKVQRGKALHDGKLLLPPIGSECVYENIIIKMREDAVKNAVQCDSLIMDFAEKLYEKNGDKQHQHHYIAQRLRELGRLKLQIKKSMGVTSLKDSMKPSNWNHLVQAVKEVAGFDSKSNAYEIPTLSLKLGHSLQKCAKILKTQSIINQDDQLRRDAEGFLELYSSEWTERISSKAHETLHDSKFNKPTYLPLAEDVVKLNEYLKNKVECLCSSSIDEDKYCELVEVLLAQVLLFNRKRSGEAQRMKLKDFQNMIVAGKVDTDSDIKQTLSTFEQELCSTHCRVEIKGKRGSKVPVLLTNQMQKHMSVLINARKIIGVTNEEYVFIKPGCQYPIRGCDCLKKFAIECGAKNPNNLTSTKLRKHLATMAQVLGIDEQQQDILAKFMGHDIRVHRQFYRLPERTLELAKVCKVLHLINSGKIGDYRGLDFNEIEFNQEEIVNEDDSDDEDTVVSKQVVTKASLGQKRKRNHVQPSGRTWSPNEVEAVMHHMKNFVAQNRLPGKRDCERVREAEIRYLQNRTWQQIKHFVRNRITAAKRKTLDKL